MSCEEEHEDVSWRVSIFHLVLKVVTEDVIVLEMHDN